MLTLVSVICLGFVLGMRHATDADHVIAVSTIVTRQRNMRGAVFVGALWGLGHTLTLLAVGGCIVLFGLVISPRLGMSMEFSVGLMLILLGAWNLNVFGKWRRSRELNVLRQNTPERESEAVSRLDSRFGTMPFYQALRPFAVGTVHGLAGSAAVALMVLPMIHDAYWALGYLLVFGVGTIAGMMAITAAIAWPFSHAAARSAVTHRRLGWAAGFASLCFGLFMVYHIGITQGLLTK
ncbi:MAG TPA: high-affinity nickel-transport family protein [Verrucomicrobiae bacterium]|jgi:high-affinity nickel-transport protein|nr:high-affinity nickel-transport family protein [Verrucomicrobiae bacterium]